VDPVKNPYSMGAGNPPPALTGREEQITQFRTLLSRLDDGRSDRSMIISGLRGVGKTVLLLEFESIAMEAGWATADPLEIRSDTDFRADFAARAHQLIARMDRRRALGDKLKRFTQLLQGFKVGAGPEGQVEFSFEAEGTAGGSGDLEQDLTGLLVEVGQAARDQGTGALFLVDEMQFLAKPEMEAIAAAMHRISQLSLPVALIGTGLPQLPGLMVEAKSYAERLFAYPGLGTLSPEAAAAALSRPADNLGVELTDEALARILALSGGYPAFIQAYGKQVWNDAVDSPIVLDDVHASEPSVQDTLDREFFHTRFEKATPAERDYMSAMSVLGDGPYAVAAVSKRMGKATTSLSVRRDALIKKGLIYAPDHGVVDFTVPHFAAFMRRRYPFGA
jgi:hypothetical protein